MEENWKHKQKYWGNGLRINPRNYNGKIFWEENKLTNNANDEAQGSHGRWRELRGGEEGF